MLSELLLRGLIRTGAIYLLCGFSTSARHLWESLHQLIGDSLFHVNVFPPWNGCQSTSHGHPGMWSCHYNIAKQELLLKLRARCLGLERLETNHCRPWTNQGAISGTSRLASWTVVVTYSTGKLPHYNAWEQNMLQWSNHCGRGLKGSLHSFEDFWVFTHNALY